VAYARFALPSCVAHIVLEIRYKYTHARCSEPEKGIKSEIMYAGREEGVVGEGEQSGVKFETSKRASQSTALLTCTYFLFPFRVSSHRFSIEFPTMFHSSELPLLLFVICSTVHECRTGVHIKARKET
jgi:hypothetical protein